MTYFTFLLCGLVMSYYEETCDWIKPNIFLQMVNVCKSHVDQMVFVVVHELEESTVVDVSVRELESMVEGVSVRDPESMNLEADVHMRIHFFLTHQVEPNIQVIS